MVTFSQKIADTVCNRIAEGESLRAVCKDADMPSVGSFLRWVSNSELLQEQYARAMQARADAVFEELFEIADDGQNDWMDKVINKDGDTVRVIDHEHVTRSRLRVDMRRWALARMSPKKYGDKIHQELTGANGAPLNPPAMNDAQLAAALNALATGAPLVEAQPFEDAVDDDDASDLV